MMGNYGEISQEISQIQELSTVYGLTFGVHKLQSKHGLIEGLHFQTFLNQNLDPRHFLSFRTMFPNINQIIVANCTRWH